MTDPRRRLPSVDRLLRDPDIQALLAVAPRTVVVAAVRETVAAARADRATTAPADDGWIDAVRTRVREHTASSLVPVLNATGVVLHTNLGRAPLAEPAIRAIVAAAGGYTTLELDLASGGRGSRTDHARRLLSELTGAEDGFAVNNAAGALVVALNALADGRDVLLSRGELIEIGGSFRIPDILVRSGARLREVGTTNRTHLDDYRAALSEQTGAILTVHRSNFEQRGFVSTPAPADLAALARAHGVPYVHDVGSGLLADLTAWGLVGEPRVPEAIAAGADLVVFSGDKLLGGPQAGCLVGRKELVARCRANPFARAMRADKLTLAALEATLALYRDPETAIMRVPVLAMLTLDAEALARRARALADRCAGARTELVRGASTVGGGAFPGSELPTTLVAIDAGALGAEALAERLRLGEPPVIARIAEGRVLLDPRTLPESAFDDVAAALAMALAG